MSSASASRAYGAATPMAPPPARPATEVRLPLQGIGTTSLWSMGRAALVLVPALAFVPVGVVLIFAAGLGVVVVLAAIAFVIYGAMHVRYAWRERPSDVLLSAHGIRIEGGRYHGLQGSWDHIDRQACTIVETTERRLTVFGIFFAALLRNMSVGIRNVPVQRLALAPRGGAPLVVAQAERPIEMDSLRALLDSIRGGAWAGRLAADPRWRQQQARMRQAALGIQVLVCHACGAPATAAEQPVVVCRYCSAQVAVPAELAQRVAAARRVAQGRRTSDRLVHRLLRQPGAHEINGRMLLLGVPMFLAWPLALTLFLVRAVTETFTPWDVLFLPLVPLCFVPALFVFVRAQLVERQALRLLTLDFGAHAPVRDGDPYTCRRCDAPLPSESDVVVTCAYCQSDNVLGIDLGYEVAPTEQQAQSLEQALLARSSEGRLWTLMKLPAVGLFLLGAGALAMGLGASTLLPDLDSPPAASGAASAKPAAPAASSVPTAAAPIVTARPTASAKSQPLGSKPPRR